MSANTAAATEPAIAWTDLGRWIGREYGIKPPHISTTHRWRLSGTRGRILPTFLVGGQRFVRPEDVRAFISALNSEA